VTEVVVRAGDGFGRISPRLYGTFAEHLGRCCYDGLWVGKSSPIPNTLGFNSAVVEALQELGPSLIRWPGGCYADHYHWRDGIGPVGDRPGTLGTSCGLMTPDDNSLGTHEFLGLCELLDSEPYLAGNVGTGSVQELADWMTYVTSDVDTALVRQRAENGRAKPWGVSLWGVGNESWDCGGRFDAVSYALEYRRYATMLRHVAPKAELVAVGLEDETLPESNLERDWNEKLLTTLGPAVGLVDHLSVHKYWLNGGPETDFGEADYYALLAEAGETEALIERTSRTIARLSPGHRIGIAFDEWGVWHPEAREWGPGEVARRPPLGLEQANTMRDALAAAIALEGFHRQCNVLSLANMAQVVNVLQALLLTDENGACVRTPTFHVLAMHRPHVGATALTTVVQGGAVLPGGSPAVSATASRGKDGIAYTLINRHLDRAVAVSVSGLGLAPVRVTVLTGEPDAQNDVGRPDRIAPRPLEFHTVGDDDLRFTLPARSVVTAEFGDGQVQR